MSLAQYVLGEFSDLVKVIIVTSCRWYIVLGYVETCGVNTLIIMKPYRDFVLN